MSRTVVTAGIIFVVTAAALLAAPSTWAWAVSRGRIVSAPDAPSRDVAIVFGAQVYPDGRPAPYLVARLDIGVELYESGRAKVLLVSGDDAPEHNRETTAMRRYLEARGVPAGRIVEDTAGVDTYDTCVRARDVFGVRSVLLVSQEYHLPRAVASCLGLGVDAVGVADVSVRDISAFWAYGARREYAANVKMARDLLLRRPPERGDAPSDAVRDALAG